MRNDVDAVKRALRVWCAQHDTTFGRLANKAGISHSALSNILGGVRKPSDAVVTKIRKVTGIDIRKVA